jgi:hypothetical protein
MSLVNVGEFRAWALTGAGMSTIATALYASNEQARSIVQPEHARFMERTPSGDAATCAGRDACVSAISRRLAATREVQAADFQATGPGPVES